MFSSATKMVKSVFFILWALCVVINITSAEIYDYITSTSIINEKPSTPSSICIEWNELLPALNLIKSKSNINYEKLLKLSQMINYLLMNEKPNVILQDTKETDAFTSCDVTDFESIVDERLKPIKNTLEDKDCLSEYVMVDSKKDVFKNNTAKLYKILAKISASLEKFKDNNENGDPSSPLDFTPVFRVNENLYDTLMKQPFFKNLGEEYKHPKESEINSAISGAKFNIPCQRASDILAETSTFKVPKDAYCDISSNANFNSFLKKTKLNLDKLPFQIVPNSAKCVDSDNSIAILFKPKKVSMTQNCGNFLKKISTNILVPYHDSWSRMD